MISTTNTRLYVGNLPPDITEQHLARVFGEDSRRVLAVKMTVWSDSVGRRYGFAFIEMATKADVLSAITTLDGSMINGRTLRVAEVEVETRRNKVHSAACCSAN